MKRPNRSYRVTTPRRGKARGRPSLLYVRWRDLRSRVHGRASRCPWIFEGLPLGFADFGEFRAFAIANGFSKTNNSPDRIDPRLGYIPGNIRFVPPARNFGASRGRTYYDQSDEAVRGPEPPSDDFGPADEINRYCQTGVTPPGYPSDTETRVSDYTDVPF